MPAILIRPRAWWYNKVPLSVTLMLLLLDGRRLSLEAAAATALVILAVCGVGNFGYAVNELFDIAEDARLGRKNEAAGVAPSRMWAIVAASAIFAGACAFVAAGFAGAVVTAAALCFPLLYSVPPVRIKERKWMGVAADALAAHVFPAALALLTMTHLALRPVPIALTCVVVIWALATGLRGILSHQLATADNDRRAGLHTVVHDFGNERVERFVLALLLPVEVLCFGAALVLCTVGFVLAAFAAIYLVYEAYKTLSGRFSVQAFRPQGQAYVPFVEESFYKAWGPIALAADAARSDLFYLAVIPAYAWMFLPHLKIEGRRLRAMVPPGRSNEES